jgi:hypothetical protein
LITGPGGITFNSNDIGVTWFFASPNLTETVANAVINIGPGTTMIFPGYLNNITNCTILTTGDINLPAGTPLNVAAREFISYGATGITSQGGTYGGGGYLAGGEPALVTSVPGIPIVPVGPPSNRLAGGGAGSWYIDPGVTGISGITYGGNGYLPYLNEYNRYGVYGSGTTGSTNNPGFLVVEEVITNNVIPAALTVNGNVVVTGTVTASDVIATTSDARTKHDIVTIDSALDKVMKLRGVYYSRNADDQRRVGVIAQEMEAVLPEVVFTDSSEDKNKSVSYGNIVGLLIEAIKEQQEMIEKLME